MIISINGKCRVDITPFAEKHYLKEFKKEGKVFLKFWFAFEVMLAKPEKLLKKKGNEIIHSNNSVVICKCYFKSEHNKSAKSGGSRVIIAWHKDENVVMVLLVYKKKHIKGSHETVWWEGVVKKVFAEYRDLL